MTQVDSSEVLFHLNNYGIKYIEKDAFERFVRDLKKLIKYEQRAKENKSECKTNVLDNYRVDDMIYCGARQGCENCPSTSELSFSNKRSSTEKNGCGYVSTNNLYKKEKCNYCERKSQVITLNYDRSQSSLSYAKSLSVGSKKKKLNNPVELYHYYESIWKHHKLPGENDHAQLRREIRNRLNNGNIY